ncbi:MAG: protein-glutamate O-methyltransferase CheR [Proteobacteria bacterium]|nr:protein-glutamate O-methyltransferase CheR [Pseudomonadota bacterium]
MTRLTGSEQEPPLGLREFRQIRGLLNARFGLQLEYGTRTGFQRRLRDRLLALGLGGFSEYCRYLTGSNGRDTELEQVVDLLANGETYFFREASQLRAFQTEVLPAVRAATSPRRRLSIWSAGCSTGEEVYTLAMLIVESGLFASWDVCVHGTDISPRAIRTARGACYREPSFRSLPRRYLRYFVQGDAGRLVHPSLRALCCFDQLNNLDAEKAALLVDQADVVFCRNVLIYLDRTARGRLLRALYERLRPGGYLLLGHSESLLRVTTPFELVDLAGHLGYRRPDQPRAWNTGHWT